MLFRSTYDLLLRFRIRKATDTGWANAKATTATIDNAKANLFMTLPPSSTVSAIFPQRIIRDTVPRKVTLGISFDW